MLLFRLPRALMVTFNDHVHTLNYITVRVIFERNDTLETQNVWALCLGDILHPWEELCRINFASAKRNGSYRDIMDR